VNIEPALTPADLLAAADRAVALAADKVRALHRRWDPAGGAPVFTAGGRYTARGWTEWTQGFQYGSAVLAFDATGEPDLLEIGRSATVGAMAAHVSHTGVHDHAFNNLSTYGNLRRLMREGRVPHDPWELRFYELAIKVSGAVQAARWSPCTGGGGGYVYSFNGPHSLFVDTMRTLRVLALAHQLGHVLTGENDARVNLLDRAVRHALTTAEFVVFRGGSGHAYDVRGRTAHEAVFNRNDGRFRSRATQQGYSPFSTWTRGLAWAMLGFAELLEFLRAAGETPFAARAGVGPVTAGTYADVLAAFEAAARATCDHYVDDCAAADGVPYWDDGAPGLARLPGWRTRPADPFNDHEPVDSSAAAIAAQGLLRLAATLGPAGERYRQAGLTVARTLFAEPYLSSDPTHEGLLLHSVYHRPNGWDHVPPGRKIPCGESSMWGDYHLLELALMVRRAARGERDYEFFDRPE
jgi:unsaturated chondroitin disaccharide hydrolase